MCTHWYHWIMFAVSTVSFFSLVNISSLFGKKKSKEPERLEEKKSE